MKGLLAVLVFGSVLGACARPQRAEDVERVERLEARVAALEIRLGQVPAGTAGLGGAAFDELAKRLDSSDPFERVAAGRTLGERMAEMKLDALRLAKEGSVRQREAVAVVLASHATQDMAQGLVQAHEAATETRVRTWLDLALGRTGSGDALEPLAADLAHPSEDVRLAAVEGLARLGDPRAAAPLARLVGRSDGLAAATAETALVRLGDPVAAFLTSTWSAQGPRERREIVAALGRVRGTQVDAFLRERLDDPAPLVALEAARVLGSRGDMAGRDLALERLKSEDPAIAQAARAVLDAIETAPAGATDDAPAGATSQAP